MKSVKVILLVIKTIEKTVSLVREKLLNDSIFYIYNLLNDTQKEKLNEILETDFSQKKTIKQNLILKNTILIQQVILTKYLD
ncbi:hypothetical protein [Clostridium tagluense]|uniref:hypothetical protein n=1 Tax=Clostridium tagluense TaxID=360422 RepID=UPI001C0BB208|nr:hypothetical protein [Clostridium tagluense]MBU3128973.1 hypothetical protein [Clostridium tagluense]